MLLEKSKKIYGDRYDYSKTQYINKYTKTTFICKKHNEEFQQIPAQHLRYNGCKICKEEATQSV